MADEPQLKAPDKAETPAIAHVAYGSVGAAASGILVAILKTKWDVDFSGQETNLAVVIGFLISMTSIHFSK